MTGPARLVPREHGAYVQLLAPLLATFLANGASPAAILFALGGCLAFLANEPLLVLLGHRGRRARDRDAQLAGRMLLVIVPIAMTSGGVAIALGSADARIGALVVAGCAVILVGLAWRRQERSVPGELVAAVVLTGAALPPAVAAGLTLHDALVVWAAWAVGYASTVIGVHRVIARHRRRATSWDRVIGASMVAATVATVALVCLTPYALIAVPLIASSTVLVVAPPSATRLRAIGLGLVGASLLSVAVAVAS